MIPVLQALVLAERIFRCDDGRYMICGTFSTIELVVQEDSEIPSKEPEISGEKPEEQHRRISGGSAGAPWAFLSMTEIRDRAILDVQFVCLAKNEILFGTKIQVNNPDPLSTVELALQLPHVYPFVSKSGAYAFQVVCEEEIIGSLRLMAVVTNQNGESK